MAYYAHPRAIDGNNVLDCGITLRLIQAISTRLVEGAEGICNKASNVILAAEGVVLEDLSLSERITNLKCSTYLVLRIASATADNTKLGVETFARQSIFAHVFPPDCS